jgi:hypothetical protein
VGSLTNTQPHQILTLLLNVHPTARPRLQTLKELRPEAYVRLAYQATNTPFHKAAMNLS